MQIRAPKSVYTRLYTVYIVIKPIGERSLQNHESYGILAKLNASGVLSKRVSEVHND